MTTSIQEYSRTEAALADLRERFKGATFDVDSTDGMKAAREARAEVRGYRTSLEKMRKDIKGPALERCRLIDDEAKRITAELVAIEEPIDSQIKAHEARKEAERQAKIDAELQRVADIQHRISMIRAAAETIQRLSLPKPAQIETAVEALHGIIVDDTFAEFREQAQDAKTAALATLNDLHKAAIDREIEQERIRQERAELEKLRAEQAARDAAERKAKEAEEAKARAAREAEERAERERLAAERKAQQAEADRLAKERAKVEAERRAIEEQKERERRAAEKAEAAARKAKFPGTQAIIDALCEHFDVPAKVVEKWLAVVGTKDAA